MYRGFSIRIFAGCAMMFRFRRSAVSARIPRILIESVFWKRRTNDAVRCRLCSRYYSFFFELDEKTMSLVITPPVILRVLVVTRVRAIPLNEAIKHPMTEGSPDFIAASYHGSVPIMHALCCPLYPAE